MNHDTIFTVKNEDLSRLKGDSAVEFFQKLLWAEARRSGIELSKINISRRVNVRDGGIDATVGETQIESETGIIKSGKTSYQIKSGITKPNLEDELFGREDLKEGIQDCLNPDSAYVLVCTGIDLVYREQMEIVSKIKEYLKPYDEQLPNVEVWSQNTLAGFLESFPSLALWVNGNDEGIFQTHQSWSQDGTMRVPFFPGESQDELIPKIRNELREKQNAVHVRVLGEPGIGKTKLVLEATRTDDLSPLVIYCTASEFLQNRILMNAILQDDNPFSAILIIDECDAANRFYISNKLEHRGSRIKMVSIYNDYDPVAGEGISEFETKRLEDERILTIIQEYGVPEEQADLYLEFCDGSPRMAHHTGEILVRHPGDPSQLLNDDYLYQSFYIDFSREDPNSQEVQQRELVLQYIALFKRFGFGQLVVDDAKAIAERLKEADEQITWSRFQKIVDDLKKRKILQGGSTLYITPKALQIKLWVEWWEIYGVDFDLETFSQGLTSKLVEWFHEMFRYARESAPALQIVQDLLGPNGPFQDSEYLNTREGSHFFLALTEADPKSALKCLMRTIGTCKKEEILLFKRGRRDVIWALEKIAMHRNLFLDAARLLLALGEAENEPYSNNASGVFAKLFSSAEGKVAPTEASPVERLPVLKEAFESGSKERRTLAIKACNEGLETYRFSRISGAEEQGLHRETEPWTPQTYGEIFDAYRQVWHLLSEQLDHFPENEQKEAVNILLQRVRGIARSPNLSDMVINTIRMLSEKTFADNKILIKTVVEFLHYEGKNIPDDVRQSWEHLKEELVGSDFHSLIQRHVGMALRIDQFDENKHNLKEGHTEIHSLAQQAVDTPNLLESELHWLVTSEAKDGYRFGYQLGKKDNNFSLLSTLLNAQRNVEDNGSTYFLGGYFRVIFEKDLAQWEEQLDALIEDATLNVMIPDLTHRSGLTDRAGIRLLNLAKDGIIDVSHFAIFGYGRSVQSLSEEIFITWIEFLLDNANKSTISIAIDLYHGYYIFPKQEPTLPSELTLRLLTNSTLFQEADKVQFNKETDYLWTEIAKVFLLLYPEESLDLVELMLDHFGEEGTIVAPYSQSHSILTEMVKEYPEAVWERVSKYLKIPYHLPRTFFLERWLQGEDFSDSSSTAKEQGVLTLIPRETIWEWVDEDVENRVRYFALGLVPKTLSIAEWPTSLTRAVLERYGTREDVRINLLANYTFAETWTGNLSLHFEKKKRSLLRIREEENNENVKRWIDEYLDELEKKIERAKVEEEREF